MSGANLKACRPMKTKKPEETARPNDAISDVTSFDCGTPVPPH